MPECSDSVQGLKGQQNCVKMKIIKKNTILQCAQIKNRTQDTIVLHYIMVCRSKKAYCKLIFVYEAFAVNYRSNSQIRNYN